MFSTPPIASGALLTLALLSGGPALASPAAAEPQVLTAGDVLRGRFVLDRRLAGFDKPLRSEGTFSLVPGRGLIWHAQKPFENTTVITAGGISVSANGREAVQLSATRIPSIGRLYDILEEAVSGDIGPLQGDFSVARKNDVEGWHLVLTPRNPDLPTISQISRLTITGRRFVEHVDIERTGGDVDHLNLIDQTEQAGAPTTDENALLGALRR